MAQAQTTTMGKQNTPSNIKDKVNAIKTKAIKQRQWM